MIGCINIRKLAGITTSVVMILSLIARSLHTVKAKPAALIGQSESVKRGDVVADYVAEASRRFGVPAAWIRAVIRVESAGNVRAVSSAGAMGLMQIMPQTWSDLRPQFSLGADPFDPRDNITAGAAYLREMYDRFGMTGFFAAYIRGQCGTMSISRPVSHCPLRPSITFRCSCQ